MPYSDNKIRCVLIYHLGKRGDVEAGNVLIAHYDYALHHERELHSQDHGNLYGGDVNSEEVVSMVIGKDPPGMVTEDSKIGGFKVVESENHHVVYGADKNGLCLSVIMGLKYPSRVAIKMLIELYDEFSKKFGTKADVAKHDALTRQSKNMIKEVCEKYADVSNVDAAAGVLGQVDAVKGKMAQNITNMLANTEKASDIARESDVLAEQANVFQKRGHDIKNKMWWENMKQTLLLSAIIGFIILLIIYSMMK